MVGDPDHETLGGEVAREDVAVAPAVLKGHDRRLRPDERRGELRGVLRVVALHEEQDGIDRADLGRVAGDVDRDRAVALTAANPQAVGREVLDERARDVDEVRIGAGVDEGGADDAAHRPGADHRHPVGVARVVGTVSVHAALSWADCGLCAAGIRLYDKYTPCGPTLTIAARRATICIMSYNNITAA